MQDMNQEILNRLDTVAAKLGVAVEHLWEIFITQSVLSGWSEAITCGIIVLIGLSICVPAIVGRLKDPTKQLAHHDPYVDDGPLTLRGTIACIGLTTTVISTIVFLSHISYWIAQIVNPEYYAWLEIRKLM